MTSAPGRYQSKLFNFITQSWRQLGAKRHLRRLKLGAVWSTQLVFYLAQGLIQAVQGRWPQGPALPAGSEKARLAASDQPIQQVLQAAIAFPAGETTHEVLARGIATQITTRSLVLVTDQNQVLDCLSVKQQRQLLWQISGYTQREGNPRLWAPLRRGINPFQALSPARAGAVSRQQPRDISSAPASTDSLIEDELSIRALIRAAVAYFFGRTSRSLSQARQRLGSSRELPLEGRSEQTMEGSASWLTWADLFGAEESGAESSALSMDLSASAVSVPQGEDIEAEAIATGYVKHSLERFLEGFDRLVTWLEGVISTLWTQVRAAVAAVRQRLQQ